ncbi:receptor-type tyrosine-protein phosphatase kappa-like isoform X2 [Haliotis asinina]|uniref:receptor-type tyrosine-protein phosphatase kappa-like isoform X2 n=1 Tax=Haliotis asinina TaxID=109174 RepID=UPI0035324063
MAVGDGFVILLASFSLVSGTRTNVAERKPAWMSSHLDDRHPASTAVDGVTSAYGDGYVAHTATGQSSAWWKVDLQTTVQSAQVILYFRTDYKNRRNGVQLYTSETNSSEPKEGNLCHTVTGRPDGLDINDVLNVTCPGLWRYLTVYTNINNDGAGPILDFAEVQVWICVVGMYGPDCTRNCSSRHCKVLSSTCDHITGTCPAGGCQNGWMDVDCTTACGSGKYGANCAKDCSSRQCMTFSSTCDRFSGACPADRCKDGWTGVDCTTACGSGKYGANCTKDCSSRQCMTFSSTCDRFNGACPADGCKDGWTGVDCTTACGSGTYGANCAGNCSYRHCNMSSTACDHINGACSGHGCEVGYMGTDCTTVCASGTYGANCAENCSSRHCKTSSTACDHIRGACSDDGCVDGWMGIDCTTACSSMMYGPNCVRSCSDRHCTTNSSTCDGVSGECPGGCEFGWTEIDCSSNCRDGYYGQNCALRCADRHCTSESCHADGACNVECDRGWTLQDCTQECPSGTYGVSCNKTCGQCAQNETCHHISGECPGGCEAGWQHELCQERLQNEQSKFPVAAVGGTVAGLLVAILVIVAVVLVRRRRRRFHDNEINKQISEFHPKAHSKPQQENGIYENVALESAAINQKPAIKPKPATQSTAGKQRDSKDDEEEDVEEGGQSPDSCYYNAGADDAVRDVPVSELAATVATLKERKDGLEKEYHRLPTGFTSTYQDSQKPENSGKNKFRGYYPYDHNRVRLKPLPDVPGSDYINASFMHSYNQGKTYIASQAPNKKTVGDFWRMIWEHSCSHVVMLTGLVEESRVKCERYWPTDGVMESGVLKIEVAETQTRANFTTRHLKVTSNTTGECRSVIQFHFTSWPDHGVPDTLALVNYIWLVRRTAAETDRPLLVHCSAGIGRTGTYIAVDSLIDQAQGEGVVDVLTYVSAMREQRKNMIQTPAQYECVFLCLLEMTTYGNTSMDVSNYTKSYSSSGMDTTVDGKTFSQLSEMLLTEVRGDPPDRHRMWVDGNQDFIVRVGPSLTCLKGYLQATAPSPGLVKLLWKLVEENNVQTIVVVTPNVGLVPAERRSKTHGEITVTTTSESSLSTDLTRNNLRLATKTDRARQVKMIRVDAPLTTEVMTSYLLNHAQLQEISTQPHPVVVLHNDNDRKLAVSFCIMGNILSGIREDTSVDVIGHVRTFLRCCPDLQFNKNETAVYSENRPFKHLR